MEIRYGNVKLYQINTILNDYNLFNYLYLLCLQYKV